MKKIIIVSDWAHDSLSCQEFKSVLEGYLKDSNGLNVGFVESTSSTVHTSFLVSQVVETEERYGRPLETVIFLNTDFRKQEEGQAERVKGAEFIIVRLASGIFICGPNAGNVFSFIRHKIDGLYHYTGLNEESQFRSRDLYSKVCAHLMDEMEDQLDIEEGPTDIIPEISGYYIVHIDNFGNIKTSITREEFKGQYEYGDLVCIHINGIEKKVRFVNNLFSSKRGEIIIYPGSSGKKDNPFLEISSWTNFNKKEKTTGLFIFNNPLPGMLIELRK